MTEPRDRETVLYSFAVEATHDRETLERYLKRYPELAEELIDLTSELRLGEALGTPVSTAADASWEAAWNEFRGCSAEAAPDGATAPAFSFPKAEAFAKLAAAVDVPRSLLAALRDGLAVATSIPDRFVGRLAAAADVSAAAVREYLRNPLPGLASRAFKSAEKPSLQPQTTFRELVENTEMSDEQRRVLIQELSDDGLD